VTSEATAEEGQLGLAQRRLFYAVAFQSALAHVGYALVLYWQDEPWLAHLDVVGMSIHLLGLVLMLRGKLLPGIWVVILNAMIHLSGLVVVTGLATGFQLAIIVTTASIPVILGGFTRHVIAAMVVGATLSFVALGYSLWFEPIWALDDTAALMVHRYNLAISVIAMTPYGLYILHQARATRRRIRALREEVREARRLGQYTIESKIGAGGMGEVYRASHSLLRRPTALKLIRSSEVGEHTLRRFEREVQLTSQLTHPNTIAIYDYGHTDDGVFYYVMEYLDGLDLGELVARYGPQPSHRVTHILRQICDSLGEAHERGLVHRDIKPANIILCLRGGRPDVVKVLDFGLVKDLQAKHATVEDGIAGTPAYLSPEAITDPASVGPRSDLYAVGAVAYFLLTGHHVFEKKTLAAICAAHLHEEPTPPSERADVQIDDALEQLALRCLEKDPAQRPESAHALRRALDAVAERLPWSEEEALPWWEAHRDSPAPDPAAETTSPPSAPQPSLTIDLRQRALGRAPTLQAGEDDAEPSPRALAGEG